MNYLDKIDKLAQDLRKEYMEISKKSYTIDQVEVEFDFLNEERLMKLKNNLSLYKDEIHKLFLEEAIVNIKKDNKTINKILFSYSKEDEGLTFIVENMILKTIHGGVFKFEEDGKIFTHGIISKQEFKAYSRIMKDMDLQGEQTQEEYMKSISSNLMIDYATSIFYIDFLVKYKKEFITVSNRAIDAPSNPKKKTKGRPKKKVNLIKKIVINSNTIKKYERQHNENIYERHIDSWTVAGHFRTYKKSGKKVWIAPYTKGTGEKTKGKTYVIK